MLKRKTNQYSDCVLGWAINRYDLFIPAWCSLCWYFIIYYYYESILSSLKILREKIQSTCTWCFMFYYKCYNNTTIKLIWSTPTAAVPIAERRIVLYTCTMAIVQFQYNRANVLNAKSNRMCKLQTAAAAVII